MLPAGREGEWQERIAAAGRKAAALRERLGLAAGTDPDELVPPLLAIAEREGLPPKEVAKLEGILAVP